MSAAHLSICASQDDTMSAHPNCDCGAGPAPCPFCGSDKVEANFGDESACYRCRNCGCQSGRVYFTAAERESDDFSTSEADALAAWNRRTAEAPAVVGWRMKWLDGYEITCYEKEQVEQHKANGWTVVQELCAFTDAAISRATGTQA